MPVHSEISEGLAHPRRTLHTNAPKSPPHLSEHGLAAARHPRVPGMVASGNIDLHKRPVVHNRDGSISTVRSISVGIGKHTVLIPTVVGHRVVSNPEAIGHFKRTGEHLGVFASPAAANRYALALHVAQAHSHAPGGADARPYSAAESFASASPQDRRRAREALAPFRPGGSKARPYSAHELGGEPTLGEFLRASRPAGEQRAIDRQQASVRAARSRLPKPLKLGFDLGAAAKGDWKLARHLGADTKAAAYGFIPGTIEAVSHPKQFGHALAKQYAYQYGPLAHGHLDEFGHRFTAHPLPVLADAFGAGTIGGKLADVAALTAKGGVREGMRGLAGKASTVPTERFLHYGGNPKGRFVVGAEGAKSTVAEAPKPGQMQFPGSPNTTTRAIEHKIDRFSERHPHLPVIGARDRIARRVPFVYERALARAEEPAIPFTVARRSLARNKRKDMAYDLLHRYGEKALERTDQEIAMREARLKGRAGPHSKTPAALLEKSHQRRQLLLLHAARPLVANPPADVLRALEHGRPLARHSTQLKIEMGELSPEGAAEALHRHSRMVTGGRYVDLPEPSPALKAARLERDRLGKQFAKAKEKRDANLEKLLAKETARAQRPVPMTLGEAQQRLASLRAHHAEIVEKVERSLIEHKLTPERAKQLLGEHDARIARAQFFVDAAAKKVGGFERLDPEAALSFENRKAARGAAAEHQVAVQELKKLQRERKLYEKAQETGTIRYPHSKEETGRRNLLRQKGKAIPTLAEELRDAALGRLEAMKKAQPEHPVVKRFAALEDEIAHLEGGVQGVQEIAGGLAGGEFGRVARKEELERLLGTRPAAETPPGKLGQRVETRGAWLRASGHAKAERLGGASSVAKDRVQQLEARALRKYGVVPGRTGGRELLGGERGGEDAAFIADVARMKGRRIFQRSRSVVNKRQPIVHKSGGILFGQGRARRGSRIVGEDFLRAARTKTRDQMAELAAEYARPLEPSRENPTGLLPGHTFYNPEGVKIDRALREDTSEEALLSRTPRELEELLSLRRKVLERHVFPTEAELKEMSEAQRSSLQQIDEKIAGAFKGGSLRVDAGTHWLLRGSLEAIDAGNNLARLGILYLKGAFIPANFLGNTAFGIVQQGPAYPINFLRGLPPGLRGPAILNSAHLLGDLRPETLRRLDTEVGSGAAISVSGDASGPFGRFTRAVAHVSNTAADVAPRRASIIYELRRRGIKTDAQVNALLDGARAGEPRPLAIANQISETAERAMVQFRGMNPDLRAIITRAIFIAPWLRGAAKYALRQPLDRPLRADLMIHGGMEGHRWNRSIVGPVPSYLEQVVPWGKARKAYGTTVLPVKNPVSVTPVGTLGDVLGAASYPFHTHQVPPFERPIQYLQPFLKGALEAGTGHDYFLGRDYPASMGPAEIFAESTVGGFPFVQAARNAFGKTPPQMQEGSPANQKLYIPEKGGWGTFLKDIGAGSLRTRFLNQPAAAAKAASESRSFLSPPERVAADAQALRKALKPFGTLSPEQDAAIKLYQLRALGRLKAKDKKGAKLNARDRFAADAATLLALHKVDAEHVKAGLEVVDAVWTTGKLVDGSLVPGHAYPLTTEQRSRWLSQQIELLGPYFGWDQLLGIRHRAGAKGHDIKLPRLP